MNKKLFASATCVILLLGIITFVSAATHNQPGTYEVHIGDTISFNDLTI